MHSRREMLVVALLAAVPTVVWTFSGSSLISDDWGIAASIRTSGVLESFRGWALDAPARPLAALYYAVVDGASGSHPVPRGLVVAGLNAVAAGLVYAVATRLFGRRIGIATAVFWAVLPNRGSARLWFVLGPDVLALCLLLLGIYVLMDDRLAFAATLFACGALAYEAVVVLAGVAIVVWAWSHRTRIREAAVALVPIALAALFVYARSPKEKGTTTFFAHAWQFLPAQLGVGVWGTPLLAVLAGVAVLSGLLLAGARMTLPSFRADLRTADRFALVGAAVIVLSDLPFFAAGFPFATDGIFDRGNIVAGLGTALLLASILDRALRDPRVLAVAVVIATAWLATLNRIDVRDYRQAVKDGSVLLARFDADVPVVPKVLMVGPPMPNRGGVAEFILHGDLDAALTLRRGPHDGYAVFAETDREFERASSQRYDWQTRRTYSAR